MSLQQPRARPDILEGALVLMELDGDVVGGVVGGELRNPIRLVSCGGRIIGMYAEELELTDRTSFELAIYLAESKIRAAEAARISM